MAGLVITTISQLLGPLKERKSLILLYPYNPKLSVTHFILMNKQIIVNTTSTVNSQ